MSIERKEHLKKGKEGVVFAIMQKGKILLEERLDPKSPFYKLTIIPGGGVEHGESFWHTLVREVKEECGCIPSVSHYISTHTQREGNVINTRHLIAVTELAGKIQNKETEKSKHLWATIKEARNICTHPSTQEFLNDIEAFINEEGQSLD